LFAQKTAEKLCTVKDEIELLLKKYDCELIDFEYHQKAFGDIVVRIKSHEKELIFSTDRGDIYYNSDLVCDHEYMRSEGKTILQKLIEVVETRLVLLEDNSIRNGF